MLNYVVSKDFDDFKTGEVIEVSSWLVTDIQDRVTEGFIREYIEEDGMEDFTVTQDYLDMNPGLVFEVGEVIKVPKIILPTEEVVSNEKELPSEEPASVETPLPAVEAVRTPESKSMYHAGKLVISDTMRTVGESEVHQVRLEDGSTMDLSDEDYNAMVEASK